MALQAHVRDRAMQARLRYGLHIDGETIARMLGDPEVLRYPTALRFDASLLHPGEFACVLANGDAPADGFVIVVHPHFRSQPDLWPLLLPYYFPDINYGETVVTAAEAELYGATLLGLETDAYYAALCELADVLDA